MINMCLPHPKTYFEIETDSGSHFETVKEPSSVPDPDPEVFLAPESEPAFAA